MLSKDLSWTEAPAASSRIRRVAAGALRAASVSLGTLARRLGRNQRRRSRLAPVLEFYAEAGAPEGALYVDGKLVGLLPGVTRL